MSNRKRKEARERKAWHEIDQYDKKQRTNQWRRKPEAKDDRPKGDVQ